MYYRKPGQAPRRWEFPRLFATSNKLPARLEYVMLPSNGSAWASTGLEQGSHHILEQPSIFHRPCGRDKLLVRPPSFACISFERDAWNFTKIFSSSILSSLIKLIITASRGVSIFRFFILVCCVLLPAWISWQFLFILRSEWVSEFYFSPARPVWGLLEHRCFEKILCPLAPR